MKKGPVSGLCAGVLLIAAAAGGSEPGTAVVVSKIQDVDAGLEREVLAELTDHLATSIAEGEVFRVVSPEDVRRASKSLYTSIARTGERCAVTTRLVDLGSREVDVTAKEHGPCTRAGLIESVGKVAFKIVFWAGRGKVEKEVEITPAVIPTPVAGKEPPAVEVKQAAAVGPVADALLTVGMTTNLRQGLHPRHESDTEYGLRIDGRFFLGSLVDDPILAGIGVGGYFGTVFGLEYGVPGGASWDTSQNQWQVEIMYRLALEEVLLKPTFMLRVGYGSTSCVIHTDHPLAKSASYGYPFAALDAYLMVLDPYIRVYASGGYLPIVAPGEDVDGSATGYTVRAGFDLKPFEHLHVGIGYELLSFSIDGGAMGETTDTYQAYFLRAGWSFR